MDSLALHRRRTKSRQDVRAPSLQLRGFRRWQFWAGVHFGHQNQKWHGNIMGGLDHLDYFSIYLE
jgi:hypothetical protein